jgi:hypothetical protein
MENICSGMKTSGACSNVQGSRTVRMDYVNEIPLFVACLIANEIIMMERREVPTNERN